MNIEIVQPGLSTTVQDLGRPGYYRLGIPAGGVMDRRSALIGNSLVGNAPGAAVLECTYLGPTFTATAPALIAVTGASAQLLVNGEPRDSWTAVALAAGDTVSFGFITQGARYFIAFAGGIDVPEVLGSRSTYALGSLGGFEHRALQAGDIIAIGRHEPRASGATVPESLRPRFAGELNLRVVMGLYEHRLSPAGREALLETEWKLTPLADRTGMRYSGGKLDWNERVQPFGAGSDPSNIVDAGYPVGSIQVPGGTEPIVLHRDAVSGGGYAMVATVISSDLDVLAQAMPGSTARFVPVDLEEALRLRAQYSSATDEIVGAITRP